MTQPNLPHYIELAKLLTKTATKLHASQAHGLITGLLTGNPEETSAWEELVTGSKSSGKVHALLQSFYDESSRQLKELLFEFEILLPDDEAPLPERAEALTLWCQGYLTGLKLAKVQIVDRKPSEMTEAINDLIEIAKMNYEEVKASEDDEAAYVELVEYIRAAVILIYEELRDASPSSRSSEASNHLH